MTKKQLGEERACYILEVTSILWGSQSRNLRQKLDAEATEEHCVLACSPYFLSYRTYAVKAHLPRHCPQWTEPSYIK